jgi:hypothetical protein
MKDSAEKTYNNLNIHWNYSSDFKGDCIFDNINIATKFLSYLNTGS